MALLALLAMGIPVAVTMGVVGISGMVLVGGPNFALAQVQTLPFAVTANYGYAVLPLFVLMGTLAASAGITIELFDAAYKWLCRFRGGLYLATIAGSAGFAAASGSTVVNAVVFTRMALPEMLKYGYSRSLSAGCIAAAGTFAAMIPPSITMVIYAIITEQSVGMLMIAGVIPGILSALIYAAGVVVLVHVRPRLAPIAAARVPLVERFRALKGVWGIIALVALVLGGIYTGIFPPSAAGATGAFGTFVIALLRRRLGGGGLRRAIEDSAAVSCVIFTILVGGLLFSRLLVVTGIITRFVDAISAWAVSPVIVLLLFSLMYIVLGAFIDTTSMMIITLPFVFPVISHFQIDPIWFGIILVKLIEISAVSPPVGLNLYAVLSGAGGQIGSAELFRGVVPFLVMDVLTLGLLIAYPEISLWLPRAMLR